MLIAETKTKILYNAADASWKAHDQVVCNVILYDTHVVVTVFDITGQRFVSLYAAETDNNKRFELLESHLSSIDPLISKRNLFLSVPKTMLIPAALYDKENRKSFLENQHKIDPGETIGDFPVKMIEAQMAYLYPDSIKSLKEKSLLANASLIPIDAAWLDVLTLTHKNNDREHIHINISDGFISIAVFKAGGLQFYNTFETATPEEVLYFVMFVSEQLHVNPHKDSYYYSGFILKTDETFNLLSKYIKILKPEERPAIYNYSMPVLDIPRYMLFNVFCTPVCES